jgi:FMN phosphatase YigB (HAD superfamily)
VIKAIIFDLDSCLSAADEPGIHIFQPAVEAMLRANEGSHSEETMKKAFIDMLRFPFDFVAEKYAFTDAMTNAGWQRLKQVEVTTPMSGYGDLAALQELPVARFLVTSGFRRLQESKVQALGIGKLLTGVHVDAIDEPGPRGKQRIFEAILQTQGYQPDEVLIVGDNPDSELAAGRRLGIATVQTLRAGVPKSELEDYHIRSLHELTPLVQTLASP